MHEQVHDRQKNDLTATLAQAALSLYVGGVVVTILLRVVSCAFCSDLCSAARLQNALSILMALFERFVFSQLNLFAFSS